MRLTVPRPHHSSSHEEVSSEAGKFRPTSSRVNLSAVFFLPFAEDVAVFIFVPMLASAPSLMPTPMEVVYSCVCFSFLSCSQHRFSNPPFFLSFSLHQTFFFFFFFFFFYSTSFSVIFFTLSSSFLFFRQSTFSACDSCSWTHNLLGPLEGHG
jgi:hypothetical protein